MVKFVVKWFKNLFDSATRWEHRSCCLDCYLYKNPGRKIRIPEGIDLDWIEFCYECTQIYKGLRSKEW